MLMPSARVSVANTALTRPRVNSSSTTSLKVGSMPAWWAARPRSRPSQPLVVAEHVQVLVGQVARCARRRSARTSWRSSSVVSRSPACRHCWTAASQPARLKMKVIAGSRPSASSRSIGRGRRSGRDRSARGPSRTRPRRRSLVERAGAPRPGDPEQVGVDLRAAWPSSSVDEQVVQPAPDQHVLPQRHRPVLGDDHLGVAADRVQPVAELLGVGDRGRQRHQPHRLGQVDDHLLPDGAAEPVGEVVHLVHDHVAEPGQGAGARVEHVAQHLGRHDDDRGLAVDAVVAGEQADLVRAVPLDQVGVLLVGQRLDRAWCRSTCGPACRARCTANSPTIVLPEPVGAATSTPLPASSAWQASIWKSSSSKSYRPRNEVSAGPLSAWL